MTNPFSNTEPKQKEKLVVSMVVGKCYLCGKKTKYQGWVSGARVCKKCHKHLSPYK